jgi:hypothetical protein
MLTHPSTSAALRASIFAAFNDPARLGGGSSTPGGLSVDQVAIASVRFGSVEVLYNDTDTINTQGNTYNSTDDLFNALSAQRGGVNTVPASSPSPTAAAAGPARGGGG